MNTTLPGIPSRARGEVEQREWREQIASAGPGVTDMQERACFHPASMFRGT